MDSYKYSCIYDNDIIKCINKSNNETYTLDEQSEIPYIIKIYKKDNLIFIIPLIIFILIIIFIIFLLS